MAVGTPASPIVVPRFDPPLAPYLRTEVWDTLPALVRVLAGEAGGADTRELFRQLAPPCLTLALGAGLVSASPTAAGPVYVAAAEARPLCGQGTPVVRIDSVGSASPHVNLEAALNLLGEDRIGRIRTMEVSPDGTRLLLLGEDMVYLLDDLLRLKGVVPAAGATSAVWVRDSDGRSPLRFALAAERGVSIHEAERLGGGDRVWVGELEPERLVALRLPGSGEITIAGMLRGQQRGVVARLPAR